MKAIFFLSLVLVVLINQTYGQQTEILNNSEFSDGTNDWWYMGANVTTNNGEVTFQISDPGINPWDIQLGYSGLTLRKGYKYTLSWRAKREQGTLNFLVQLDHSPYTYIFGGNSTHNNDWIETTVNYEHTGDDITGVGIAVHMGGSIATAVFDYISLKEELINTGGGGNTVVDYGDRGYYDAPYKRYEADNATLANGAFITPGSYNQADIQYEASDQVCVNMNAPGSSVEWEITEAADGLVIRYSLDLKLPAEGKNHEKVIAGMLGVYVDNVKKETLDLTTYWSWEDLRNNDSPNAIHISNKNWRKRFDEVRIKLNEKIPVNSKLKLVQESGDIFIDFAELEPIAEIVPPPAGAAIYNGNGSDLQSFIYKNGGKVIYLPSGVYAVSDVLWFNRHENTKLQGAGMWHTQIHFNGGNGGLYSKRSNISYADLYLTTDRNSREQNYAAIRGAYDGGATIERVWTEHFGVGAWIAQYDDGIPFSDGLIIRHCRFRNSYADGTNLCEGSRNCVVEHCNYRNNGDDDMAIWPSQIECSNNTFRYNTSENCWRAHGAALYGGKDNKFHNLLIKDAYDAGITASNGFERVGFNEFGMHEFFDITIIAAGTKNCVFNDPGAAITINTKNNAGDKVRNVRFSNIDIINSKDDAILIEHHTGYGIENISFENIHVNGTGKEYPYNNANNITGERGYLLKVNGNMNGFASLCNLTIENRGGSATKDIINANIGNLVLSNYSDCSLKVNVTAIKINNDDLALYVYEKTTLIAEILPQKASEKTIIWSSSNSAVASVTQTGVVKAISAGTAIIRATTQDGNFADECTVTVKSLPIFENKGDGNPLSNVTLQRTYLFDRKTQNFRIDAPHTDFEVDEVITFAFDADENLKGEFPIDGYKSLLDWANADPYYHNLHVHIWSGNYNTDFVLQRIPNSNIFIADICLANLFGTELPASYFKQGNTSTFSFAVFAHSNPDAINGAIHWRFVQPTATLTTNMYSSLIIEDFESKTIGNAYTMKRINNTDGSATVAKNPAYDKNNAVKVVTNQQNTLLRLNITLPEGKVLADYNKLMFDIYLLPDDNTISNNYNKINIYVDGVKIYEDADYPLQAEANKWTTKQYELENLKAGSTFVLDLGLSSSKGNYYIDNVRLKPKEVLYQVSVSVNPTNSGTVTGVGTYNENSTVNLTATPAAGYRFKNWTIADQIISIEPIYSFHVVENIYLLANFETVVGVSNPSTSGISIFPNPTNGVINIFGISLTQTNLSALIYSADGRLLIIKDLNSTTDSKIDISNFDTGLYCIMIFGDRPIKTQKIIKR